jgi:hypothetical protein
MDKQCDRLDLHPYSFHPSICVPYYLTYHIVPLVTGSLLKEVAKILIAKSTGIFSTSHWNQVFWGTALQFRRIQKLWGHMVQQELYNMMVT